MAFKQYRTIQQGEFFICGYDMAMGGTDFSSFVALSKTNQDVPLVYHAQETATITTNKILPVLQKIQQVTGVKPVLMPEANAGGVYEIDRMLNSPYSPSFTMYRTKTGIGTMDTPEQKKYGWYTTSATRPKMLEELKNAIDNKLITIYDEATVNEMFAFIVNKKTSGWKAEAENGKNDDLIMALAIAWQGYQTEQAPIVDTQAIQDLPSIDNLFDQNGFY